MALSTEDRLLLREVFHTARAKGWGCVEPDRESREWSGREERAANVNLVKHDLCDEYELRVYEWEPEYRCILLPKVTVREAVDLLALLHILPSEFSSAYRAAREQHYANLVSLVPEVP